MITFLPSGWTVHGGRRSLHAGRWKADGVPKPAAGSEWALPSVFQINKGGRFG